MDWDWSVQLFIFRLPSVHLPFTFVCFYAFCKAVRTDGRPARPDGVRRTGKGRAPLTRGPFGETGAPTGADGGAGGPLPTARAAHVGTLTGAGCRRNVRRAGGAT